MKKLFLSLIISSTLVIAQTEKPLSILQLKQDFNSTTYNNPLPDEQVKSKDIPGKKSAALAMFYSLLLPGMGELYGGSYSSGKYFTIADGVIWGFYAGMHVYGNWQRNNYKDFASSFGGVNSAGKDADYYATIGDYLDINEYNTAKALDRDFKHLYNAENFYWKWSDQSQRREYRGMWVSSEQSFNNVRFAVGALIVNRIISAINAVRVVSAHNKKLKSEMSWNISVSPGNYYSQAPSDFTLNFVTTF